jgi:hypothetical protein
MPKVFFSIDVSLSANALYDLKFVLPIPLPGIPGFSAGLPTFFVIFKEDKRFQLY